MLIEGFVGKAISPFEWMVKEKQGLKLPYDFTVFGISRYIEINPETTLTNVTDKVIHLATGDFDSIKTSIL